MYEYEVLLKNGNHDFIWGYDIDDPGGFSIRPRLAVRERRGQFFVSIGNLHNFPYAFLVNLTKEIFPKPLDFLCRL